MLVPDPANFWSGHTAKLLDFGMVRLGDLRRTAAGQQLGTPLYMAPEQIGGDETAIGPWSDVFSLGVMLVELLTLRPTGPEESSLRGLIARMGPRGLRHYLQHLRPDLPPELHSIILRALAPQPADRFRDAHQLLGELRKVFPWLDTGSRSSSESLKVPSSRRRRTIFTAAAMAMAMAVAMAGPIMSTHLRSAVHELPAFFLQPAGLGQAVTGTLLDPAHPHASPLIATGGAEFRMGSTELEIAAAVNWCLHLLGPSGAEECPLPAFQREFPQRLVYVSPFAIEKTEVSNIQLARWLNTQTDLTFEIDPSSSKTEPRWVTRGGHRLVDLWPTPSKVRALRYRNGRYQTEPGTEELPAVQVSWYAARDYCASMNRRLPTEAEWEFVARSSESFTFPWGSKDPTCNGVVIARESGDNCAQVSGMLAPVGVATQDRTPQGVLNLAGNVAEWVHDAFEPTYWRCAEPCRNPVVEEYKSGTPGVDYRVFRGGSWSLPMPTARSATRSRSKANTTSQTIGFRCAVTR